MVLSVLSFLTGIIILQQLVVLPDSVWLLFSIILLPFCYIFPAFRLLFWSLAGFVLAWGQAWLLYQHNLPASMEGKNIKITGEILSVPEILPKRSKFLFKVHTAESEQGEWTRPGKISLSWYHSKQELKPGQVWQFTVRLKRPNGFMNPAGFDYEAWLFQQGINAVGYIRKASDNQLLTTNWNFQRIRQHIRKKLTDSLWHAEHKGIMFALGLGMRDSIDQQQWDILQRTGTSHLIAISGLHIGLVAGFCFFIARFVWLRIPRLALLYPAPKLAAIFAMTGAVFYAFLAGFAIPTQRALIMVSFVMLAILTDRTGKPARIMGLSLFFVLLLDTTSVLSPGFWLSFSAVAVLLFGMTGRLKSQRGWRSWGKAQWIVTIGLLPLTLYVFQKTSLISPVANMLAIPWVSFVIVPLLLLGTISLMLFEPLGDLLLSLCHSLLKPMHYMLSWLSDLPFSLWVQHSPPLWVIICAALAATLLLSPAGLPVKRIGLVLILPVFLVIPTAVPDSGLRFTVLDVGQGLASVIETRNHVIVFDSGPRFSDRFDTGDSVVIPYLRQQGVSKVDLLVISHGDNDHSGGAFSLNGQIDVMRIVSGEPEKLFPLEAGQCKQGMEWEWDGVKFSFLHPVEDKRFKKNDRSCVLKVISANGSILLTGDIHKKSERHLVKTAPSEIQADILVAPHHGSKTSSHTDFIDKVKPGYVIFPVGYRNRFKHPRPEVVKRYDLLGAEIYDSSSHGAIQFLLDGKSGISRPLTYRQANSHHWHRKNE